MALTTFNLSTFATENVSDVNALVDPLPTGSFLFDYITGVGGLPRGRMVEAFGPESSGKSTAFYQAIASAQRAGGYGLILDYENAFVGSYGRQLGMDTSPEKLLVECPLTVKDGFQLALKVTRAAGEAGVPLVVVFDSLAAMPMDEEMEVDAKTGDVAEDHNMTGAQRAKAITNWLRKSTHTVREAGAVWCFVNHELDVIHTGFVTPAQKAAAGTKRTPGGRGVKFYCSQRFQFAPGQKVKGDVVDPVTGEVSEGYVAVKASITAVKNKVAPPLRRAQVLIRYGLGIDEAFSVVDVGIKQGLITRPTKQTYEVADLKFVGVNALLEHLRSDPALMANLREQLVARITRAWEEEQERLLAAGAAAAGTTSEENDGSASD